MPFFEDAYVVRALCVAYDLTGNGKYLETCRRWADNVVALQSRMIPQGAYYMNYERAPGEVRGDWYVADSSGIGMAVLATRVRTPDAAARLGYLSSVEAFTKLVIDNYVGEDGGVTDGLWSLHPGEWWASTSGFGQLLFLLHAQTASPQYLEVALRVLDWMLLHGPRQAVYPSFEQDAPAIIFYYGEFHVVMLHHLARHGKRPRSAHAHIAEILEWMSKNQKGRGAPSNVNYFVDTYMAGMPYVMTALVRVFPEAPPTLRSHAEQELHYVADLLFKDGAPDATKLKVWELMSWTMMSYAEMLRPGAVFRSSNDPGRSHPGGDVPLDRPETR